MLKFSKNNDKGITMIALTITVIVLLILASITLAQLTDDNSVVKKAQESKNETESAQKYENETTSNILATIPSTDNEKRGRKFIFVLEIQEQ